MISLTIENGRLIVTPRKSELAPIQESQLAYWGFKYDSSSRQYISPIGKAADFTSKVAQYFTDSDCHCHLDSLVAESICNHDNFQRELQNAKRYGHSLKEGTLELSKNSEFLRFLKDKVPRQLKDHQIKAALHLLAVTNGANFSVPGSGKTTVVLTVFLYLRELGEVDSLFVVGPPACFGPWRYEYEEALGIVPSFEIFAGGDVQDRRSHYLVDKESVSDLFLTSYQTLQRDYEYVETLFKHQGIKFFFVIDEAHYIKQLDGLWAKAALTIARYAQRRCILTGTPFPRSYTDSFNLFDALWPEYPPISQQKKHKIEYFCQENKFEDASKILDDAVSPLFYRVRKTELGLAAQNFHQPRLVKMYENERRIYDAILDNIQNVSRSDFFQDLDLLIKLRRGRLMRLRQCLSYPRLLQTAIDDYDEDLLDGNLSLAGLIACYDNLEKPAKLDELLKLVGEIINKREKLVIWSNFVKTLHLIQDSVSEAGCGVRLIFGGTPVQNAGVHDELSREEIIRQFVSKDSGIDVLVANPAACSESISLHKTCTNAIYYDLSYNCAQYLQSLDRIHRVGGSEYREAHYYFLQYEDSLDQDILNNLRNKASRMGQIIDQEYPIYSLDMFTEDEEIEAYERLFG